MLYNLYIGSNNATGELEDKKAIAFISKTFEGLTVAKSEGYWQGKPETSMIVSIETDDEQAIKDVAKGLCKELEQQAVGVAIIGRMQFIS